MPEFGQNTPAARALRTAGVRAEAARRMSALAAAYTPEERETWPLQIAEAEAVLAGYPDQAPMLTALAAPRGLSVIQMAETVLRLRDQLKLASAAILAAQAALLAMDPIPADYSAGRWWP
ncbi:hypothetical protein ACLGGT_07740 [Roseovarius sp. MS2]|uniref:hypothetical protein n=1 Tax=Roseovarius sp. MS2 TaxID=3390728 RepID=UPI003EDC45EE